MSFLHSTWPDAIVSHQISISKTQAGVPEQVLVGLLREQAAEIERFGYIPRRWEQPDQQEVSKR